MCLSIFRLLDQNVVFGEFQKKSAISEDPRVFSAIKQGAVNKSANFHSGFRSVPRTVETAVLTAPNHAPKATAFIMM